MCTSADEDGFFIKKKKNKIHKYKLLFRLDFQQ